MPSLTLFGSKNGAVGGTLGPNAKKIRNLVHGPYMGPYIIPNFWMKISELRTFL